MKFRQRILSTGTNIFLGRDEENNNELMKIYSGKENTILHTVASGSPFCVIEKIKPTKAEIYEAGTVCARYSQDWRDNKNNVRMSVFNGKETKKNKSIKTGTWGVK